MWNANRILLLAIIGSCVMLLASGTNTQSTTDGLLLVINKGDHTLSIVDPEAGRELAAVPVGGITAHEVAASPDGRTAWVPIYGDSGVGRPGSDGRTLTVIDLNSRKPITTIDFKQPTRPHCAI